MVVKKKRKIGVGQASLTTVAIIIGLIMLYPFLNVLASSFSSNAGLSQGVTIFPKDFTLDAYKAVFTYVPLWRSMAMTFFYTVAGTAINMVLTILCAYVITRKHLPFKKFFVIFTLFPMWFNAGIIPTFITIDSYHMVDTVWAMLMPMAISIYNMVVLKTYFEKIPPSLEEAARIDGANDIHILFHVDLPSIVPGLVTVAMFYMVSHLNSYIYALLYLRDDNLMPVQMILRQLTVLGSIQGITGDIQFVSETIKYAAIVITTIPVLIIFPFMHKFYVKGAMSGAVKE